MIDYKTKANTLLARVLDDAAKSLDTEFERRHKEATPNIHADTFDIQIAQRALLRLWFFAKNDTLVQLLDPAITANNPNPDIKSRENVSLGLEELPDVAPFKTVPEVK